MSRSGAVALGLALVAAPALAHKPTVTTFTYHRDIYPIFEAKCGSCHRSGGVAPMSLMTYKDAYPWAVSIKNQVLHLSMPPWFADDTFGVFKHDAGLSAKEMDTIVDWCLGGSPEGEPAPSTASGEAAPWALGEPDRLLLMPEPVLLDSDTSEARRDIALDSGVESDGFIRAVDFRPGAPNVVRSATLLAGSTPIATWLPGQRPVPLPEDRGYPLRAGEPLVLRVHYKKTWLDDGSPVEDRSVLALYLVEDAEPVRTLSVTSAGVTLDAGSRLLAILPQLSGAASSLRADLVRPDGAREPLIRLYDPSPEWPRKYWLEEPTELPSGSRIELRAEAPEDVEAVVLLDLVPE